MNRTVWRWLLPLLVVAFALGAFSFSPPSDAGWKTKSAVVACSLTKACRQVAKNAATKAATKCATASCINKAKRVALNGVGKAAQYLAKRKALRSAIPSRQLQAKFKHAKDFGIEGNFSSSNAKRYSDAIKRHISSSETEVVKGVYRGNESLIFIDRQTRLGVITKPDGSFVSGWRLTEDKITHLFKGGVI